MARRKGPSLSKGPSLAKGPSLEKGPNIDLGKGSSIDLAKNPTEDEDTELFSGPKLTYESDNLTVTASPLGGLEARVDLINNDGLEVELVAGIDTSPVDIGIDYQPETGELAISGAVGVPGDLIGISGGLTIDTDTGEVVAVSAGVEFGGLAVELEQSLDGCQTSLTTTYFGVGISTSIDNCKDKDESSNNNNDNNDNSGNNDGRGDPVDIGDEIDKIDWDFIGSQDPSCEIFLVLNSASDNTEFYDGFIPNSSENTFNDGIDPAIWPIAPGNKVKLHQNGWDGAGLASAQAAGLIYGNTSGNSTLYAWRGKQTGADDYVYFFTSTPKIAILPHHQHLWEVRPSRLYYIKARTTFVLYRFQMITVGGIEIPVGNATRGAIIKIRAGTTSVIQKLLATLTPVPGWIRWELTSTPTWNYDFKVPPGVSDWNRNIINYTGGASSLSIKVKSRCFDAPPSPPPPPPPPPPPRRENMGDECCRSVLSLVRQMSHVIGLREKTAYPIPILTQGENGEPVTLLPKDMIEYLALQGNSQVLKLLSEIANVTGRSEDNQYPGSMPASMLGDGGGERKIYNLTDWLLYLHDTNDERLGQWEIRIDVENKEGEKQPIKLDNLAEAIAEIYGLLLQLIVNSQSNQTFNAKNLLETGLVRQQVAKSGRDLKTILDTLGFDYDEKKENLNLSFSIETDQKEVRTEEDLLEESTIPIPVRIFSDSTSLKEVLGELKQAAAIIRAVHWRKLDPKKDMGKQVLDYLNLGLQIADRLPGLKDKFAAEQNGEEGGGDRWDAWLEKIEEEWSSELGRDDGDRTDRPRIREIGRDLSD